MRNPQASLKWIMAILQSLHIPFQVTGGLAAKMYGAQRDLLDIDIDIPEDKFTAVASCVQEFISYGPASFKTKQWNLMLMTLNHHGQEIDLGGAYHTKIYNAKLHQWQTISVDFSKTVMMPLWDLQVPVVPCQDLLAYKKILARPVDLLDIEMIESCQAYEIH